MYVCMHRRRNDYKIGGAATFFALRGHNTIVTS